MFIAINYVSCTMCIVLIKRNSNCNQQVSDNCHWNVYNNNIQNRFIWKLIKIIVNYVNLLL